MLTEAEQKFRSLVEHTGTAIAISDLKGKFTYINQAAAELLGYSIDELMGRSFKDFIHPQDKKKIFSLFLNIIPLQRHPRELELRILRRDGSTRYIWTKPTRYKLNGRLVGFHTIIVDVTERKIIEEQLRESEEKFRNLAEESPNMIFINQKGSIIYANKKCEEIMGYTRKELYSHEFNYLTLIAPESRELVKHSFKTHMKSKEFPPYEYVLITKQGKKFDGLLTTKLIRFNGETAILGIITDLSKYKALEYELIQSKIFLESIIEHIPEPVYIKDKNLRYVLVNMTYSDFIARPKCEILGKNDEDLGIPENEMELFKQQDMKVFETGEIVDIPEQKETDSRGVQHIMHCRMAPLTDENGEIQYIVGIERDITDRKQMEKQLRYRLEFENLIASLSTRFINVTTDTINKEISYALQKIGEFAEADRSYIFLFSDDKTFMTCSHEWCADEVSAQIKNLQEMSIKRQPWMVSRILRGETVHVSSIENLPDEAQEDKILCQEQDVQSVLLVPIKYGQFIMGFIGFDSVKKEKRWSQNTIVLLKIVGEFFARTFEHKQMEESLKASEEKFRSLATCSPVGIYQADMNGGCTYVNEAVCKFTGLKPEEHYGEGWVKAIHPDDRQRVFEAWDQSIRGKHEFEAEFRFISQDKRKEITWVTSAASPLKNDLNQTIGFMGTLTDITARKKVEKEMRNLAKFPDENPNPVFRIDMKGTLIAANKSCGRLLKEWNCKVGEEVPQFWRKNVADVLESQLCKTLEVAYGRQIFLFYLRPMTVSGYVNVYGRDISERKHLGEIARVREQLKRSPDPTTGLERILDSALTSFNMDIGSILIIDKKNKVLTQRVCKNKIKDRSLQEEYALDGAFAELESLKQNKSISITVEESEVSILGTSCIHSVPISVGMEVYGLLCLGSQKKEVLDKVELNFLNMYAYLASTLFETRSLVVQPIKEAFKIRERACELDFGETYLVREDVEKSFTIFTDNVLSGVEGLCISRIYPPKIRRKYGLQKTPIIWLTEEKVEDENTIYSLQDLSIMINNFLEGAENRIVLLDGIEYLITNHGFDSFIHFLQITQNRIERCNSILVTSLVKEAVKVTEASLIERETTILKSYHEPLRDNLTE